MNAMIVVGGTIVLISILFVLLLIVAVASRRFRGAAIGLLLMSLLGGTVFLVFAYLMASQQMHRVRTERLSAEIARQQRLSQQHSMAEHYQEGIVLDDEPSVVISSEPAETSSEDVGSSDDDTEGSMGDAEIANPEDMSPPSDAAATTEAVEGSSNEEVTSDTATDTASLADTAVAPSDSAADDSSANQSVDLEKTQPYDVTHYQIERPSWVTNPPKMVDGHAAEVIVSDAYETGDECEENLNNRIAAAIQHHAAKQSRDAGGPGSVTIQVGRDDIRRVSRDRHLEVIDTSVGPMKQIHQLVVFDNEFERRAKQQVTQAVVGTRLAATGALSGGALILLATSFGLLRFISRSSQDA